LRSHASRFFTHGQRKAATRLAAQAFNRGVGSARVHKETDMTSMYRAPVLPTFAALLALVTSHAALADTTSTVAARVLSAKPVYAQVQVPQQVCWDDVQQAPAQGSGAGALMGAIAGGAMGNAIGGGSGQVLATGLGIFGGAILGNRIETQGQGVRTQQ